MIFSFKLIGFFLLFSSMAIFAQEQSRQQKIEEMRRLNSKIEQIQKQLDEAQEYQGTIREEILSVSDQDKAEAEKIGADAIRLFPDKIIDEIVDYSEGASVYVFEQIDKFYLAPRIEYKNNSLEFIKIEKGNFGFIANIGDTPLEAIDEQNRQFIALSEYQPPPEYKDVKSEYVSKSLTFGNKTVVIIGNTYLARVIRYGAGDAIFALRIHRRDTDESIILFVKKLKTFSSPKEISLDKPSVPVDYETVQKVQNALLQKGFNGVMVDGSTNPLTLRGTVPKGKLAEAVAAAQEANGGKPVRNEIVEQ